MRIAMFTETFLPNTDGIVTRLAATLRHLEEAGHEVLLFAPKGSPSRYACANVIGIPAFRFFLYPEKKFSLPWPWSRIGKAIKEFQPDFIHVVNPALLGLGGIYYAWRFQLPLIASYHTNIPGYARHYRLNWLEPALWWYFRTLHNRADINLCTSKATLVELQSQGFKHLGLWERGVDYDAFSSGQRTESMRGRLAHGLHDDSKILLYVGRLAAEKGIERLRNCLDEFPNVHLAIVGDGPHRHALEEVFAGTRTVFVGYLHGQELSNAYASADGFLFPSTTETLGLVLFEAMASGLPVLAADSPPTREVLEDGQAGIIFDPHSNESIYSSIRELFGNEARRQAIISRGREIAKNLDWRGPTVQLIGHYRRLTSEYIGTPSDEMSESRSHL